MSTICNSRKIPSQQNLCSHHDRSLKPSRRYPFSSAEAMSLDVVIVFGLKGKVINLSILVLKQQLGAHTEIHFCATTIPLVHIGHSNVFLESTCNESNEEENPQPSSCVEINLKVYLKLM